jgi:serine protease Do
MPTLARPAGAAGAPHPAASSPSGRRRGLLASLMLVAAALLPGLASAPASANERLTDVQAQALARALQSTVAVHTRAVDGGSTAAVLGRERQGSGVVIDARGMVLTIGYLILEADEVELRTDGGRRYPARVVAYDVATGFGLVQPLVPMGLAPVPLGDVPAPGGAEPLLIASGGPDGGWSAARLLARRAFSGYWEYHIEGALFTTPPRPDHSGAGLFNLRGELLGIGSLLLSDASGPEASGVPGNMFVPVDLLRPIMAELLERGRSRASDRAWLGLNCVEQGARVRVVRVNADSPAAIAGVRPGDQILRIDGTEVRELATLWKTLWSRPGAEREVLLDIRRDGDEQQLRLMAVDRAKTLRRPQGV